MHTIFETDMLEYRRKMLTATCLNAPSWEIHVAWLHHTPLIPLQYPEILEFAINSVPNPPDSYWNASGFLLIHQRLAAVLNAFDTPHEAYPVMLRDKRTKYVLPQSEDYLVYRILATAPLLDPQTLDADNPHAPYRLNPDCDSSAPPVCLDETFRSLIFVHDDARAAIEAQSMTGCRFLTIDQYNALSLFSLLN